MKSSVIGISFALVFAVLTGSCADDEASEQETSVQEYFQQVAAVFQQANEDAESIELAPEGTAIPRKELLDLFRDYYRRYLEVVRNLQGSLKLVDPPIEVEDGHGDALRTIDELIRTVEGLSSRADEADPSEIPDAQLVSGTLEISYRLREACNDLQREFDDNSGAVELPCEQADNTRAKQTFECHTAGSGVVCCGAIAGPVESGTTEGGCSDRDASNIVDFAGIRGHFEPIPDLPPGLTAVSEYLVFEDTYDNLQVAGFALPLTEPVDDPSTLGFYTYSKDLWERVSDVLRISGFGGVPRAEGEFTSVPANLAVLSVE